MEGSILCGISLCIVAFTLSCNLSYQISLSTFIMYCLLHYSFILVTHKFTNTKLFSLQRQYKMVFA